MKKGGWAQNTIWWRLGSLRRALILVQLQQAVSSLLEDGDRRRGMKRRRDKERVCWLKQVDERLKERKRRTGFQAVRRNTCCSSAEEKEGVGGHCKGDRSGETAQQLGCVCLATVYLEQWQTYESLAGTTGAVLQTYKDCMLQTSVWQWTRLAQKNRL